MNARFAIALLCSIGSLTALGRAADVPPDAATAVSSGYKLSCVAVLNPSDANMAAAFATLAPGYTATDVKGATETRDQAMATTKSMMQMVHATTCDNSIDSETLNADGSVGAATTLHLLGSVTGPDGAAHQIDATVKAQDTWKQINGTWLVTNSIVKHNTVKVDGQLMQDEGSP